MKCSPLQVQLWLHPSQLTSPASRARHDTVESTRKSEANHYKSIHVTSSQNIATLHAFNDLPSSVGHSQLKILQGQKEPKCPPWPSKTAKWYVSKYLQTELHFQKKCIRLPIFAAHLQSLADSPAFSQE